MVLTQHQQFHIDAVKRDVVSINDIIEHQRILNLAEDFEAERLVWPTSTRGTPLNESDIHDYIEKQDRTR